MRCLEGDVKLIKGMLKECATEFQALLLEETGIDLPLKLKIDKKHYLTKLE